MDSERELNERQDDLRATSEDIVVDATSLKALEEVKGSMSVGDPRLVVLARAAEKLGEKIAAKTSLELALAEDSAG
ncbi:MAG TPA: hypothetical protein VM451_02980 [Candidatus Limnocylindria bacterium]|nr:hypothetical protein [Candidatus Limnocylindria bacterium]